MADYDLDKLRSDKLDLESVKTLLADILTRMGTISTESNIAADNESDAFISDYQSNIINTVRFFVAWKMGDKQAETVNSVSNAISDLSELIAQMEYEDKCQEIYEREYNRLYGNN